LLSVAYVREKDKRGLCICLAACIASFQQNTLFPREIAILQPPIKVALFTSANVVIFSSPQTRNSVRVIHQKFTRL
jgi:hypothetical protein